jgi:phosphatidylinositol alpha-mannosyltransferase
MRVGLFHSTLPEPGRKPGGVEQFVHRLGNALTEHGHDVVVWTLSPRPLDATYRTMVIGSEALVASRTRRLLQVPALLQRTTFGDRDVLHLHGDDWFFVRRGLPTVRTLHGSALYEARYATSMRRRAAQSLVFPAEVVSSRLATLTFAVGPGMPKPYRVAGVLPLGFDDSVLEVERSQAPSVLFVGTWEGRKRGRWLVEQFARVRERVPNAELWVVADRADPVPGVQFLGRPTDAELRELYASAWVFCLPSRYEGFGMPYIEAMAQGTPVVTTRNPGAIQALAAGGGEIVQDDDLADALAALLTNADRRRTLSGQAQSAGRRFSWERSVTAHETVYAAAIERWRSPRP